MISPTLNATLDFAAKKPRFIHTADVVSLADLIALSGLVLFPFNMLTKPRAEFLNCSRIPPCSKASNVIKG